MEEKNLKLQAASKRYIHSTGRWYKFFAVVCIVGMSVCAVLGILMILMSALGYDNLVKEAMAENGMPFAAWVLGAIYLITAGLMLPMTIFLMRAAKAARTAVALNNNEAAVRFLRYTKSYWKFYGILTIVMLGISVIIIPAATVFGILAAM